MEDKRIIEVLKKIIDNIDKVNDIRVNQGEYLFLYYNKYVWGIKFFESNYILYFYPKNTLDQLENTYDFDNIVYTSYNSINYKENILEFKTLYEKIKSKFLGLDDLFEDILNS